LGHTLAEAKRNPSLHAVCHMDLDQFKVVNNSCGHEAGDRLLNEISNLLVSYLQAPNIVARTGGDEFLFIFMDSDIQNTKNYAMEIKDSIQEHRFKYDGKTYTFGTSIGITAIDEAIQQKLIDTGVDYMQAFHIEKPTPLDNLLKVGSLV